MLLCKQKNHSENHKSKPSTTTLSCTGHADSILDADTRYFGEIERVDRNGLFSVSGSDDVLILAGVTPNSSFDGTVVVGRIVGCYTIAVRAFIDQFSRVSVVNCNLHDNTSVTNEVAKHEFIDLSEWLVEEGVAERCLYDFGFATPTTPSHPCP